MKREETREITMRYCREDIANVISASDHLQSAEEIKEWESEFFPERSKNMNSGWVYALINPSMPGLVKIGSTTICPFHRCEQLSKATSCPHEFELVHAKRYTDCREAELRIHWRFREYRYSRKEFFMIPDISSLITVFYQTLCQEGAE